MGGFFYLNLSSYYMLLFVNELMAYHCNGLDKHGASISSLYSTLHGLTPNPFSYIVASITLVLIIILYSNIVSSCGDISDDI